ncbi:T9SS type A sorting domain-containing protein, partial [Saprospiraceae bacterium]|nr:T9SS type A sorting domain-containing protein [Saprospiraceae bacterium]
WIMGDDEPAAASAVNRDLSIPRCNSSMPPSTPRHTRGMVMGHWFFTLTNGNATEEVAALPMETTINLLIEGLSNLANQNAGFPQLRTETLLATELTFGVCSEEYSSLVNAWDYVCVTGASEPCPCDLYTQPDLFADGITNECPKTSVELNDLHSGNTPPGAILVWSQDDDPTDGVDVLPSSNVSIEGTYYAYYYNDNADCFGPISIAVKVSIVECCEDPTVDYIILNENGNPQTDFCVGDDVFLNGCVSVDATKYFIGIWEYELGGFAAGEDNVGYSRTSPFWINAEPGCMMSLDDIWANFENYEFRAGHEYRVQFAVQNECSTEWIVKEDGIFTMAFPTPDYTYVDENGIPKNVFCVGETVFLDGSESIDENKFFLSIWQYNIGGFAAGESQLGYSRLNPSWAQGEVGSLINLNEIWANFQGDYFEPGFEYRVQLAVKGECSNGWNVKEDELFIVICCEGPSVCDAEFTVSTEEDKEGNISFDFNGSHEIYFEHTWTVFSHPASGTGPYTQVASSNNPDFSFEGTLGGCYTVVHEVVTPCGSCCYSREICNDSEGSLKISSSSVDCDLLCTLVTPAGLACTINKENAAQLIWDEVPGATSYQVVMVFNDPDCCGGEGHTQGQVVNTEENFLTLGLVPSCFSWKVRAICHEEFGQFSGKVCFNSDCGTEIPKDDIQADIEDRGTGKNSTNLEVYPNPTSQMINYSITLEYGEAIQNIALIDMNGKLIENIDFEPTTDLSVQGTHVLQNDLLGIYFIRLQLNSKVVMKKIMIIR